MCFASGKMALRVRMRIDLLTQRLDLVSRRRNPMPYPCRRRTANDIMNRQYRSQTQAVMKALIERGIYRAQLVKRKILKLAMFVQAQLDGLAYLLVRQPRRNSSLDKEGRGRPCIHETRLRGLVHALEIELDHFHPAGD